MCTEQHPIDITPPPFLQLAGHRLRWRLLIELSRSDRVVSELTELIGEPQNLVSYHLGKLRDGQLVSAQRSSADRRDTYYGLNLARISDMLTATGGALHPGLKFTAPPRDTNTIGSFKVLFLCTGNSARSQMAEVLIHALSGGVIEAHSAGSNPKPLHPNAVRVMREDYGLDLSGHASKHLEIYTDETFDRAISLCDRVREVCPSFNGVPEAIHWSIANPATGETDDVTYPLFQQTAAELVTRIEFLLATLTNPMSAP
tara:strand:+ start:2702 stop:3475 length:774 start_codon:yes stop_codon:yes gene_type:complete